MSRPFRLVRRLGVCGDEKSSTILAKSMVLFKYSAQFAHRGIAKINTAALNASTNISAIMLRSLFTSHSAQPLPISSPRITRILAPIFSVVRWFSHNSHRCSKRTSIFVPIGGNWIAYLTVSQYQLNYIPDCRLSFICRIYDSLRFVLAEIGGERESTKQIDQIHSNRAIISVEEIETLTTVITLLLTLNAAHLFTDRYIFLKR